RHAAHRTARHTTLSHRGGRLLARLAELLVRTESAAGEIAGYTAPRSDRHPEETVAQPPGAIVRRTRSQTDQTPGKASLETSRCERPPWRRNTLRLQTLGSMSPLGPSRRFAAMPRSGGYQG